MLLRGNVIFPSNRRVLGEICTFLGCDWKCWTSNFSLKNKNCPGSLSIISWGVGQIPLQHWLYIREKWHLPASLAPVCITQPPFCLHFRWKYMHCWTEELELRQWILILLLPQDKPAVPHVVEKADCATLLRARRWPHHLPISQSWPVEIAWNLNELPDTAMGDSGSYGDGDGGVRRALTCESSPWATSLSQGGHRVSLGHPQSSKDVSILMRRRVLTW